MTKIPSRKRRYAGKSDGLLNTPEILLKNQYDRMENELVNKLQSLPGLPRQLEILRLHQLATGFIRDDLKKVTRFQLRKDDSSGECFIVQYNPERVHRFQGGGRKQPPMGIEKKNDGCFLCRDNIWWQQFSTEIGLPIKLKNTDYTAWNNPFPLKANHYTVATNEHKPQAWKNKNDLRNILNDLTDLAQKLEDYLVFYNGDGAGASIRHHRHFQCFGRETSEPFPLERSVMRSQNRQGAVLIVREYPITFLLLTGTKQNQVGKSVETVVGWATSWEKSCPGEASANIIATTKDDLLELYFVPRNRCFSQAPGLFGIVGSLEVLGEIVLCTEAEKARLDSGQIDYYYVRRVLASVQAPGIDDFLKRVGPLP